MRASAIAALVPFIAGIFAAPAPVPQRSSEPICEPSGCEVITVSGLSITRKEDTASVSSVKFNLAGSLNADKEYTCSVDTPVLGSSITRCGDSNYSFQLDQANSEEYALLVKHELGAGRGLSGETFVEVICSYTGDSGDPPSADYVCKQNSPSSFQIRTAQ